MTDIIITMAGRGSRFLEQGYTQPKFMIEVRGRTLFQWSMASLANFNEDSRWHFVTLKEHVAAAFIEEQCSGLGISLGSVVEIDSLTSGQAESALRAMPRCDPEGPCLIYNIDTYVDPVALAPGGIRGDGWIPCFDMPGDHWSFVRLGADGWATEVREKTRISNLCSIGLYWFRTGTLFMEAYEALYGAGGALEAGETYIAPMYNALIARGCRISVADVPADSVVPLGTPEEVRRFEGS